MRHPSPVLLAPLALVALGACSGSDQGAIGAAPSTAPEPAAAASRSDAPTAAAPRGDCDLLSVEEIQQAFGGTLSVSRVSGRGVRGSGCTVSIAQGEDSQLVLQAGDRAAFDARNEANGSQSRVRLEPVAIGAEAYRVNDVQVIAIDAQGRSISVGLALLVFGGELPIEPAGIATGVETLARTALERL